MPRNNVKKPKPITLTLDKKRNFLLDLNAYSELDTMFEDKTFDEVLDDFLAGRPYAVRAFLWAGLIHEDENLTIKDVGRMISPGMMDEISEEILKGLNKTLPEADGDEKN